MPQMCSLEPDASRAIINPLTLILRCNFFTKKQGKTYSHCKK